MSIKDQATVGGGTGNGSAITTVIADSTDFNEDLINNKSSFSHIPMDTVIQRVDNGTVLMAEMAKIFQARLDVEDREIGFSIRVSRPNLYELEIPSSTAEKSLGYLKNYYLFVSREQAAHRRSLDEDLISELERTRLKRLNQVTEHKNNINDATDEAATAASDLAKAKQSYIKVLGEVEIVRQKLSVAIKNLHALKSMTEAEKKKKKEEENKYSMGRLFSAFDRSPEDECKHQSKKLKKLEAEMVVKRQDIADKKKMLLDKIQRKEQFYTQAAVVFEKAEKDRLHQTEKALRQYCTIEKLALEARLRLLKSFEEGAIAQLDSASDVQLFATKARDLDNTRMYSNALKMMEWDYKSRVENGDVASDDGSRGHLFNATDVIETNEMRKDSVWADVDGDTELKSFHPSMDSPEDTTESDIKRSEASAELKVIEEEVTRIIDQHFDEKPSLDYLVSKLQKTVGNSEENAQNLESTSEVVGIESSDTENLNNSTVLVPKNDAIGDVGGENLTVVNIDDSTSKDTEEISSADSRVLFCVTILGETIFGSSENSEEDKISESEVRDGKRRVHCLSTVGFSTDIGRNAFLQLLDDKRGRHSTLVGISFDYMTVAMKIFLDCCMDPRCIKAALRLANMSITFHKLIDNEIGSDSTKSNRHYVQNESEINQHELWHTLGFWDDALSHGLREQITMMEPVQWDELEPEVLKEKVAAIHNILFGQLGTLAFTMHEMGLEKSYVQSLVMNLGKASQLGDDLQRELLKSINISFGEEIPKVTSPKAAAVLQPQSTFDDAKNELRGGDYLKDAKSSSVRNEEINVPHEHGRLNESKESDVQELL